MSIAMGLLIAFLFVLLVATGIVVALAVTIFSGAPWVPTHKSVARAMCTIAQIKPGDRVLDLGCGDGAILLMAAREFGAIGIGVELNPLLVLWARVRARLSGVADRVTIVRGNMFIADLPDADVVMLYLLPRAMRRIEGRLKAHYALLRVVSNGFMFESAKPVATMHTGESTLRMYSW